MIPGEGPAVRHGHYPDGRSERKGSEPEGVAVGTFGDQELAFVGSERGNFVSVYALGDLDAGGKGAVRFQQLLPTGAAPEGILPIPQVGLLAVANEGAGTITVYRHGAVRPAYPTIVSGTDPTSVHGDPFGWAALSGLAAGAGGTVYAVPDNAMAPSRVFTLDTGATPAVITGSKTLTKGGSPLKADLEGIAIRRGLTGPDATEGFWAVSEGGTTTGPDNFLFQVGADGAVSRTVILPPAVDANQLRWGFEGVTVTGTGTAEQVYVAFQREWSDDPLGLVRVGRFTPATGAWAFFHYRLDTPSTNYTALQTGLSELVALDGTTFAVIERDSLSGPGSMKRIYSFSTDGVTPSPCDPAAASCPVAASSQVVAKTLLRDLAAEDGFTFEKVEGLARLASGELLVANDNDGAGETGLLRLASGVVDDRLPVKVQLLGMNDFHGNLRSPGTFRTSASAAAVPAGGVEFLATHIKQRRATNPNTMVVSAGDLIGASPLLSALFHDEPTIEAMNELGLDLNAVGNHEFDEGATELRRMQVGGCHPADGCLDGNGFAGADFGFLAANVIDSSTGLPFFDPYAIREFDGVKVGFIGMTLQGTPEIVTPSGVAGLEFRDEADTVNALVPELRAQGVEAIVVLLHEGGADRRVQRVSGRLRAQAIASRQPQGVPMAKSDFRACHAPRGVLHDDGARHPGR